MDERIYCVYCHQCKKNGKRYIGITSNTKKRWNNGNGYKQHALREDIQKYGWDGFDHIILKSGLSVDEAKEYEKYFIEIYSTTEPMLGYNHKSGGQMCDEETVKKINESKLNNGTLRGVVCVETGERFSSTVEAAKKAGVSPTTITHICARNRKAYTAGGYHWCYEEDATTFCVPKSTRKLTPVICEDTGEKYGSLREAERKTGTLRKHILKSCNTGAPTNTGQNWKYCEV